MPHYVAMVAGVLNLIYMLVPLNGAGQFQIHTYVTGDHYVDAWGFLR